MAARLASLITLVGTLAVAALGYWQWRRTQSRERAKEYRAKRVETLGELWTTLNDIEEQQRTEMVLDANVLRSTSIRRANLMLLRSAPFLQSDEQQWASSIVYSIIEIDTMMRSVRESGEHGAGWWLHSVAQPTEASIAAMPPTDCARPARRLRNDMRLC